MSVVKISVGSTKIVVGKNGKVTISSARKAVFNKKGTKVVIPNFNIVSSSKKSTPQYHTINVLETSLDDLITLRSLKHEIDIYDGSRDEVTINDKFPFYPSNI